MQRAERRRHIRGRPMQSCTPRLLPPGPSMLGWDMRRAGFLVLSIVSLSLLSGCSGPQVHLQDRHGLSYPLVDAYTRAHPGTTLVLLDYHHDVGQLQEGATSAAWVGRLLLEGRLARVLWVSGRDLLLPNRNARMAWLRRKLAPFPPADAASIASRMELVDWADLRERSLGGPLVVTLDFDLFAHDPGEPPERFVDEIADWLGRQRPGLVTLALSAAYERDPAEAWGWYERFITRYAPVARHPRWSLEGGPRPRKAEGGEEAAAWAKWAADPPAFSGPGARFLPGAAIWLAPPASLRRLLLSLDVKAGDAEAADAIAGWRSPDMAAIEAAATPAGIKGILEAAAEGLENHWRGRDLAPPPAGAARAGLDLRLLEGGKDRGCLALYAGVGDTAAAASYCAQRAAADPRYPPVLSSERPLLVLELSLFGPWAGMSGPLDFRPGADSLLLVDGREVTLLQASVAAERGYGREEFLERLSSKAGLGAEGWRRPGLRFEKAATVWTQDTLAGIEAGMAQ